MAIKIVLGQSIEESDWIKTPTNKASEAALHKELARWFKADQAAKAGALPPTEPPLKPTQPA